MTEKRMDTANEPVDQLDDELMDTGILHEKKTVDDEPDGDGE